MSCDPTCGGCSDLPYKCFDSLGLRKGSRLSFVALDGSMFTGTIAAIDKNRETGEINVGLS